MSKSTFSRFSLLLLFLVYVSSACRKESVDHDASPYVLASEFGSFGQYIKQAFKDGNTSTESFIQAIQGLKNVSDVHLEGDLIFITTKSGLRYSVDLYGRTSILPIKESDMVDTCGTAINQCLKDFENGFLGITTKGVVEDPTASVEDDDSPNGDESIETRALALKKRKILPRKSMAIWAPWPEFAGYDTQLFLSTATKAGFNCIILGDYSPLGLSSLGDYDLVYIGSHGCSDGALSLPSDVAEAYLKPFSFKGEDGNEYLDEKKISENGIRIHYELINGVEYIVSIALEYKYLKEHLSDLSNTIVFTSVCHAGQPNSAFLAAARSKHCVEFYGADNSVESSGEGPMSVFKQFIPLRSRSII